MSNHSRLGYLFVSKYLKECREKKGLTQKEVGEAIGIHSQFVSNWERGRCGPPEHCYKKLIRVLQVDKAILKNKMILDRKAEVENFVKRVIC